MTRFGRGWRLARRSLSVLRAKPSLALFPAVTVLTFAALFAPGAVWAAVEDVWWVAIPFTVAGTDAATFVPILAFEGLASKPALARSATLVRERWGEGATGIAAIMIAVAGAGLVPAAALAAVAVRGAGRPRSWPYWWPW